MSAQTTFDTLDLTDAQNTENKTTDSINYQDITSEDDLIKYTQQYAAQAISEYDIDVDLDLIVEWRISTRAKRRAAAVRHLNLKGLNATVGMSIDWDSVRDYLTDNNISTNWDDPQHCAMILTWRAFETFDENEWQKTIRHELIHVEQYQKYGTSNHRRQFKTRAAVLDTENGCPKFYTGQYLFVCSECGDVVGDRTRRSKYVKMVDPNHSMENTLKHTDCCDAELTLEMNENTD